MKRLQYIIVPALAGLFFTACNNEPKGPSQAELDTQVEAKVKATQDQLKADCDTRLMQAAQLKADSTLAKLANKKAPAPAKVATTPAPTTKTKTPPPPPKQTTPPPPKPLPNTNTGKKNNETGGMNQGKKDATNEKGEQVQGQNMGKKK